VILKSGLTKIVVLMFVMLGAITFMEGAPSAFAGNGFTCISETIGNVNLKGATSVLLDDCTVTGSVRIKDSTGDTTITNSSSVSGNVEVKGQTAGEITIEDSYVSGNIEVKENVVDLIHIEGNSVDGNIELKENEASPSSAGSEQINVEGNEVYGNISLKDNVTSGAANDIDVVDNIVWGSIVVKGNDAKDDVEIEGNDVWGDVTVRDNTAGDDVDVEDSCMLGNGDITVRDNEGGANPTVGRFGGNDVQGNGADSAGPDNDCSNGEPTNLVLVGNTSVGIGSGSSTPAMPYLNNHLLGDLVVVGNSITKPLGDLRINENDVDGSVKIEDNTVAAGDIDVMNNDIGDDLKCKGNDPDPTKSGEYCRR